MFDNFLFLAPPITTCILMAGILGYFGNHILSRGIIFIDIAVAQIAALGTMIGLLIGFSEGSIYVQIVSYVFTLALISVFALTKFKKQLIPQEAIIGILYCLSLGVALFFADRIPGGSNYITKTITGNILWVTWRQVFSLLIIFLLIGVIHIPIRKFIIKISDSTAEFSYVKVRIFELLFYITFGIVIVKSVPIAGIFLVFILLIAPAASAALFCTEWKNKFIMSWIIGITGSIIGMYLSYFLNISNGPAIVCVLGIIFFILAITKFITGRVPENKNI